MANVKVIRQAVDLLKMREDTQEKLHLSVESPGLFVRPGPLGAGFQATAIIAIREQLRAEIAEINQELADIGFEGEGLPVREQPAAEPAPKAAARGRGAPRRTDRRPRKTGLTMKSAADRSALARAAAQARWHGKKARKATGRRK